jgi:Carboxypeptidase regulatory-like domain/TonB dependent receptor-like, beta-barrel
MSRARFLPSIVALAAVLVVLPVAQAQFRASIQGVVTDSSGAVVPSATLTLTNKETNQSRQATSGAEGAFAFANLAPGRYSIVAKKDGFKTTTVPDVAVAAEKTQGVDVKMDVGQLEQQVTVSAEAEQTVETETAQVGGTISTRDVQDLPALGRDPFQLLRLAPGVFGQDALGGNLQGNAGPGGTNPSNSIFQTENQPQISANGQRTTSNNFQVDGMSVNSIAWNGAAVITPNVESVKEVQVVANNYSAEYGRNNGAQVLVVSQNGTNSFHGSGLFKAHRPGLNAYNKWNGPGSVGPSAAGKTPQERGLKRDSDRFNQWAGSVGGPIIKNRLFFFFSYETLRLGTTSIGTGWYESPEFLSAGRSGSIAEKILTYPGEGVSANAIIPRTCADAGLPATNCQVTSNGGLDVGSPLTSPLGTPDPTFGIAGTTPAGVGNGLDGIPDIIFVNTTNPTNVTAAQWNGRVDFQLTNKDSITFSTYWTPVTRKNFNGPIRAANAWTQDRLNWSASLVHTHIFGPTLLNEARFNSTRWSWDEIASNPQEPWGLPQSNIDSTGGANVQFFGAPGPSVFAETTYNFRDTVSKVINTHNLRLGVDIYKEQRLDTAPWSARPQYNFHNLWDFANDAPFQEVGNFDPRTGQPSESRKHIRSGMYAGFIQDDWKFRPNLTLNLGLRWEYLGPVSEIDDNLSNVTLGTGANTLTGLRLKTGGTLFNASKNNWGPQVGFAWSPMAAENKLVFRAGFGMGYNRQMEASILDVRNNPPGGTVFFSFPVGQLIYAVPSDVNQFTNWPANPNAVQTFDPNTGLPVSGAIDLTAVEEDLPTTLTYRYSLDMQYELANTWVATLGYQGSQTRHNTIKQNLNYLYSPLNPSVRSLQWYGNIANASYNGLLAGLRHRFSSTFEFDTQYRWSHTIDQGSNDYYIPTYPWDLSTERGSADYDVRHNFKMYGIWSPQFFKGRKDWLDKIVGGWTVSGILNWHSGFPWTPLVRTPGGCNVIYQNSGICYLRPAAYSGAAGNDQSNDALINGSNFANGALSYFTPASFTAGPAFPANGPIPQTPGVARNSFRGPHYLSIDMNLAKSFGLPAMPVLGENARIEIRSNFYNIFNKLNLRPFDFNSNSTVVSFDGTTSNGNFGRPTEGLSGRVVELQARFSF